MLNSAMWCFVAAGLLAGGEGAVVPLGSWPEAKGICFSSASGGTIPVTREVVGRKTITLTHACCE